MTTRRVLLTCALLAFTNTTIFLHGLELDDACFKALGMESGKIQDSLISASSSYDSGSVGPHHGRLRNNKQGGAWCPRHMVSRNSREYLEIDLGQLHVLTGIKTQGRYGNGQGQEYAEQYMIEYWRAGLQKWARWKDRNGKELLSGNADTFTIVEQTLDPPPICSKVRILPYSDHVRTVCMRVELAGCTWKDGLQSYNMPQGLKRGDLDFSDRTYDGTEESGYLSHGLGQLTDGIKGKDNFKLDLNGHGKGYEWIGWRNDTPGPPLEIVFEFEGIRNFSAAHLHTNNMFTKDVQVFSQARAFFSLSGDKYNPEPVHFSYMPDLVMEHSRNVTIKLHQRMGRYLKLQLYFASRWILLSEVSFESTLVRGNYTEELESELAATLPDFPLQRDDVKATLTKGDLASNLIRVEESSHFGEDNTEKSSSETTNYIGMVIGALTVIILILLTAILLIVVRNQRAKQDCTNKEDAIKGDITGEKLEVSINSQLSSMSFSNYADLVSKSYLPIDGEELLNATGPPPVPPPPKNYRSTETELFSCNRPARSRLILPLSPHKMPEANYVDDNDPIKEISSEKLRPIEKIGNGQFGELHLCETPAADGLLDSEFCLVYRLGNDKHLDQFRREAQLISRLHDPNVAALLGASLNQPPYLMVREYAPYGDLCQFLQDHVAESATTSNTDSILSYGCLIHMATQIASGMKHLELKRFVHKDLAARNCLVGHRYQIKISDLGRDRELYQQDYCRPMGVIDPIPLRWMAWECVFLDTYTSKSDVWSFAVLLWEIITFAREQPYEYWTDDKVLENLTHYYQNNGKHHFLNLPRNCPKDVYELMTECWNRNESDRPDFQEIHLFLQRKNLANQTRI